MNRPYRSIRAFSSNCNVMNIGTSTLPPTKPCCASSNSPCLVARAWYRCASATSSSCKSSSGVKRGDFLRILQSVLGKAALCLAAKSLQFEVSEKVLEQKYWSSRSHQSCQGACWNRRALLLLSALRRSARRADQGGSQAVSGRAELLKHCSSRRDRRRSQSRCRCRYPCALPAEYRVKRWQPLPCFRAQHGTRQMFGGSPAVVSSHCAVSPAKCTRVLFGLEGELFAAFCPPFLNEYLLCQAASGSVPPIPSRWTTVPQ